LESTASADTADDNDKNEEDDDDEYEYVEFDTLDESDFAGSEWLMGTQWENRDKEIDETWCRLFVTEEGKNLAFWGDDSEGTWNFDVASQFLTVSKDTLFGKKIWACTTDDYYYLSGTVRGWTYLMSARVLAQWQARRLGADPEEAGVAPWFAVEEEGEEEDSTVDETAAVIEDEGIFKTIPKEIPVAATSEEIPTAAATSEEVIAKQPIDLSVVYDAPAKLAYEASDKSMAYGDFKTKYEADAIAEVIAKQPIDLSVVYDAPAKLAYESSDKSMAYGAFKTKYEADAIADVIAKKTAAATPEETKQA
jgi:hypothetical protein